jgi:multisubunit Na+/H+ antiporter MnhE subunit
VLVLVIVESVVVVAGAVVVSSRQPHQPGVLHVSVRVRDDVLVIVLVVEGLVCVPFSNFHR